MIGLPPIQFDVLYNGPVKVLNLTWDKIEQICGKNNQACTIMPLKPGMLCTKFMPLIGKGGVSLGTYKLLDRHENGHCNGWKHD